MKKLASLFLLALCFTSLSQNLQFFDREMIVKHKIKEIWEQISDTEKGTENWIPCPNYYYKFDKSGNIVGAGEARVSTGVGYKYNNLNQIVDIFWEDKRTGEVEHYFSSNQRNVENPHRFKSELKKSEERLGKMLSSKTSYQHQPLFSVSDSCAMINAEYILSVKEEQNGLPLFLKAYFNQELEGSPTPRKPVSPKQLYIYYVYEFYK
jgi:hypothetical protein